MRTKVLIFFLLYIWAFAKAEQNPNSLVICLKDGSKVTYSLVEKPSITFTETDFVITTNGVEVNYSIDAMARICYECDEYRAINDAHKDMHSLNINGDYLLLQNLKESTTVSVHSLNGTLIFKETIDQKGEFVFSISNLEEGIYLITANGITHKIVKK